MAQTKHFHVYEAVLCLSVAGVIAMLYFMKIPWWFLWGASLFSAVGLVLFLVFFRGNENLSSATASQRWSPARSQGVKSPARNLSGRDDWSFLDDNDPPKAIAEWNSPKTGAEAKGLARLVAKQKWRLTGASIVVDSMTAQFIDDAGHWRGINYGHERGLEEWGGMLKLSLWEGGQGDHVLLLRSTHPSVEKIGRLNYNEMVRFVTADPLLGMPETELSSHLRVL